MSKPGSPGSGAAVTDCLELQLTGFLTTLAAAGYAEKTRQDKRRSLVPFLQWLRDARRSIAALDETSVLEFLARPSRRRRDDREHAAVHQFLAYLRRIGVAPPRPSADPSPAEELLQKHLQHLRDGRGLCARSIEVYTPLVRAFVAEQELPERLADLDASSIRGYLLACSRGHSFSFMRLLTAALRSFLRFVFLNGGTAVDLSTAVPPVRRWRFAAVPPFLTPDEVEHVIAAADRSTVRGLRSFAILLLLARLGLRAGEVVALELDDIHWNVGEIVVRGKGRCFNRLPLLQDVGEALALYLRQAREPSTSRRVFLRTYAPHEGLSGPTAVCCVARDALRRAEVRPIGRVGAHIFRHSLATRMIRRGALLEEISQVLRHSSVDTTRLYTKVEFEALRGVALSWPTEETHP